MSKDNVYLNVSINAPESPYVETLAEYSSINSSPILQKASDYYCSVIRFDIPLNNIPNFICPIIPNQGNPNLTPLIIGINYLGTNYFENLIYLPASNVPIPIQNVPNKQVITNYYFIYSYNVLLNMCNNSLRNIWASSGLAAANPGILSPYFELNTNTGIISLIVNKLFTAVGAPKIYLNMELLSYLDSFNFYEIGFNQPDGRDLDFILNQNINTTQNAYYINGENATITVPPNYYRFTQDYSLLALWSSMRKILITTNTIPISYEYANLDYNDTQLPILTDFVPIVDRQGQSRSIAYYVPTSQYRLCDLISDGPLQKIDLKIFWQDEKNNIYPLTLTPNQQINIKIAFIKKDLYNGHILTYK